MFDTIRSKIIILTVSILLSLSILFTIFVFLNLRSGKYMLIEGCNYTIMTLVERLNKEISNIENSTYTLAVNGELFYNVNKKIDILNYSLNEVFSYNKYSIGGGVWFEPNAAFANKKLFFDYAYKDKYGNVIISHEPYEYLNQIWYKDIKSKIKDVSDVMWSRPYYESQGSDTLMITAGSGIYTPDDKLIGIATVDYPINFIVKTITKILPTPNSFALFADRDDDFVIVSTYENLPSQFGDSLKEIPWYSNNLKDKQMISYQGVKYISYVKTLDNDLILIINVPEKELFSVILRYTISALLVLLFISVCIALGTYLILRNNIDTPIEKLTGIAHRISQGDLDTEIKITKPREFADLANTFDKMIKDIKQYLFDLNKVTKQKELYESELSIARSIQYSALPNDFYLDKKEFEVVASMDTAKDVGGDFYDFFLINKNKLMFLIADVSGKGVPAALFMMTTKTLIKNMAELGYAPEELFNTINNKICTNNEQGLFVTLFAGIINLATGKINFINCGHNPPLIKRGNGKYEYLGINPNLVLGAMQDVSFKPMETKFEVGDSIFMYTDGITEAINENGNFYGEEKLQECLNSISGNNLSNIIKEVRNDIRTFVGGTEQSDDITMLMFKYNGYQEQEFTTQATVENYNSFDEWLTNNYGDLNISDGDKYKIKLSCEEIYTNVASYAYPDKTGDVTVTFKIVDNTIVITFIDEGIPYNPLKHSEPDINLSADARDIGGLGIFMVKQSMDSVEYEFKDNKNILRMKLNMPC